ncbi:tyrosine-type recombinase/integrase [Streptomyces sp. DSM 44915]|uniref:Tyrosine-type recombinase/integrase n=1 Tax=Streptomyces chisholmiae TaxID=3075540 RepID=A0ABU2K062_9ACTN|nr:tyrosine-type recombinase/integrase [Streptomyces sp. DSM 44915]MDT0270627.1 tyrosine-type recombinase/integrase [Streptomyces sp. DSM 44915]
MAHAEKRGKWWRGRYKRPDGSWGSVSQDDDGQRFRTKRAAEQFAEQLEADVRRRTFIDPRSGRSTVADWAAAWIESIEVGPLTLRDYRSRLAASILPRWGATPVGDITPVAYTTWERQLREEGYAENSISGIRSLLRTMLDDAVASKLRVDNPVPSRRKGRRGKYVSKRGEPKRVYPNARQALYVARNALALRGLPMYAMVLTSYYTGLRIGELAGLTRDRLHLDGDDAGPRILLEHQSQYVDGKPALIPAKYGSGRGLIIHRGLADLLRRLLEAQSGEWVFTAPKGGRLLIGGDFYSYTWRPIVDGRAPIPSRRGHGAQPGIRPVLGMAGLDPHGLRHGQKVALDEAGHPRVAVEERMGHTLQGVEGVYSHTTLAMELKIAETLQSLWEDSFRPSLDRGYGPMPTTEEQEKLISQKSPKRPRKVPRQRSASADASQSTKA